jgi:hypothetical protein
MNRSSLRISTFTTPAVTAMVALSCIVACSSSTGDGDGPAASVSGAYTGNITNGQSSCPGNWQAGQVAQVTMNAVQSGSDVSLDVTGGAGLYVQVALGASTFNGNVTGDDVNATLHGTTSETDGNCTYTWSATFAGGLSGDTLSGNVTYVPVTNGGSDCTAHQIEGCSETQSFDGVRPATATAGDGG